jgi:hypothetical protein
MVKEFPTSPPRVERSGGEGISRRFVGIFDLGYESVYSDPVYLFGLAPSVAFQKKVKFAQSTVWRSKIPATAAR